MALTTSRILLNKALNLRCADECIDWAVSLLEAGLGGDYTARLAGMLPPFNHFEIAECRDRVLDEIGAPPIVGSGFLAARPFIADSLEAGLRDDDELLGMLVILKDVYTDFESARELSPFHLLYYAFDDLVHQEEQWYWDGATRENIRDLIRAEAMRFIEEERRRSRQQGAAKQRL